MPAASTYSPAIRPPASSSGSTAGRSRSASRQFSSTRRPFAQPLGAASTADAASVSVDDAVDLAVEHLLDRAAPPSRVAQGLADHQQVVELAGRRAGTGEHLAREGAARHEVGDHPDRLGAGARAGAGRCSWGGSRARCIAACTFGGGVVGDAHLRRAAVQDVGRRRDRDTGASCDVGERGLLQPGHSATPPATSPTSARTVTRSLLDSGPGRRRSVLIRFSMWRRSH